MIVCAIHDSAVGAFQSPFVIHTEVLAVRAFKEAIREGNNNLARYPLDHSLFILGAFDEKTGVITALDAPRLLAAGSQFAPTPDTPGGGTGGAPLAPSCQCQTCDAEREAESITLQNRN